MRCFRIPCYRILIVHRSLRLRVFGEGTLVLVFDCSLILESWLLGVRLVELGFRCLLVYLILLCIYLFYWDVVESGLIWGRQGSLFNFLIFLAPVHVFRRIDAIVLILSCHSRTGSLGKLVSRPLRMVSLLVDVSNRSQLRLILMGKAALRFIVRIVDDLFFLRLSGFAVAAVILWRSGRILNFNNLLWRIIFISLSLNHRGLLSRLRHRLLVLLIVSRIEWLFGESRYGARVSPLLLQELSLRLSELLLCLFELFEHVDLLLHGVRLSKL